MCTDTYTDKLMRKKNPCPEIPSVKLQVDGLLSHAWLKADQNLGKYAIKELDISSLKNSMAEFQGTATDKL